MGHSQHQPTAPLHPVTLDPDDQPGELFHATVAHAQRVGAPVDPEILTRQWPLPARRLLPPVMPALDGASVECQKSAGVDEPLIERTDYRVNYLCDAAAWGIRTRINLQSVYKSHVAIWRSLDQDPDHVTISITCGSMHFQDRMTPAEARRIAQAMLVAADEAEAAKLEGESA